MTENKKGRAPEPQVTARLTPRELAAVLNEPRRTPAVGIVTVAAAASPVQPDSALAVASAGHHGRLQPVNQQPPVGQAG